MILIGIISIKEISSGSHRTRTGDPSDANTDVVAENN